MLSVMLYVIMLSGSKHVFYAECHIIHYYSDCQYAGRRYAEFIVLSVSVLNVFYAECHYTESFLCWVWLLKVFSVECNVIYCYAECHSTCWRYAECIFLLICCVSVWWKYFMLSCFYYYADSRYADCRSADCRSAECRGTFCCHCCCWKRRGLNRSIII